MHVNLESEDSESPWMRSLFGAFAVYLRRNYLDTFQVLRARVRFSAAVCMQYVTQWKT